MKFCSQCGNPVTHRIPEGDTRLRFVCDSCHTIHYQNPNIVAGCVATWGTKVLLCRRAIEPRRGYWTLPAGFMENGETIEQAATAGCQVFVAGCAIFDEPYYTSAVEDLARLGGAPVG